MQCQEHVTSIGLGETQTGLLQIVKNLQKRCNECKPVSAAICVTDCRTWKLKNQIRSIHEKMQDSDFVDQLFNTLKNKRRLEILNIVAKQHDSLVQLQTHLRSQGFGHSRETIVDEYLTPLIQAGLVQDSHNPFALTIFGSSINGLVKDFQEFQEVLPPHSECNEEKVLMSLIQEPKTLKGIKILVPNNTVPRVLSRLEKAELVQTPRERDYVFFFKTKRDPHLSNQTNTEGRVYEGISEDGISAKRLSAVTKISLRRVYKYLRKLKGKKLIFARTRPMTYSLTDRGKKLADILKALRAISIETQEITSQFLQSEKENVLEVSTRVQTELDVSRGLNRSRK